MYSKELRYTRLCMNLSMGSGHLIAIILITHFVASMAIQRQAKTRSGLFGVSEGKVLRGHVIGKHHVTSEIECSLLCLENTLCLSYNYKLNGAGNKDLCELNNATRKTNPGSYVDAAQYKHYNDVETETSRSCLDYLRNGATQNGIYTITDGSGDSYKVWCDLSSEPGSAWTLILSVALKNRGTTITCKRSLAVNSPTNENSPNWEAYRLSLKRMKLLANQSTHWRATTGFSIYGVDYTDYIRGKLSSFDIISYHGESQCKAVEYVDIRGHKGTATKMAFWQMDNVFFLHTDSSLELCPFSAKSGSVPSENNFGFYCENSPRNQNFRGTEDDDSTTEWWLGGYL